MVTVENCKRCVDVGVLLLAGGAFGKSLHGGSSI
jgi:hypothetical protein